MIEKSKDAGLLSSLGPGAGSASWSFMTGNGDELNLLVDPLREHAARFNDRDLAEVDFSLECFAILGRWRGDFTLLANTASSSVSTVCLKSSAFKET